MIQLSQVARGQKSTGRPASRRAEKHAEANRRKLAVPEQDDAATGLLSTPEEEARHADAYTQAQVELIETTMLVENADPE